MMPIRKSELRKSFYRHTARLKGIAPEDYHFSKLSNEDDETITEICKILSSVEEDCRRDFAKVLDKDSRVLLAMFAERMAMLSIREGSIDRLLHGLVALSALDYYEDFHAVNMILSILYASATRLNADSEKLFQAVGAMAVDEGIRKIIQQFPMRDLRSRSIEAMGYHEIAGPSGTIFLFGSWLSKGIPDGLK
jgi:hypothetical protein